MPEQLNRIEERLIRIEQKLDNIEAKMQYGDNSRHKINSDQNDNAMVSHHGFFCDKEDDSKNVINNKSRIHML